MRFATPPPKSNFRNKPSPRDVVNRREEVSPWNLIARGFRPETSGHPGFRFLHCFGLPATQLLSPLFNQPLPTASK
jgi:hypothetical protein